jgi:8-oxo-dGTP diphosphatase
VLIERKNYPQGIALPGGFIDVGERIEDAAKREAQEEIGAEVQIEKYLGYWDNPDRDPRAHNIAHAFLCSILSGDLQAGDDAKTIVKVAPQDIDTIPFAFPDHKEMIVKALQGEIN